MKNKDWSAFASDFEERSAYVVGKADLDITGIELEKLKDFGNVLELGCGTGVYTYSLAAGAETVLATDISKEMVETASARYIGENKIKVEQADCFRLLYPSAAFDTVFMANLLHVVPNPEEVITEAARVLKSGGRIIVSSLTTSGMNFFDKMCMGFRYLKTWGKPPKGGTVLTVNRVAGMLENNGFSINDGRLIGERSKSVFVTAVKN